MLNFDDFFTNTNFLNPSLVSLKTPTINKSIKFYYEYKNNKHCQSLFFKYLDLKKKQDSFDKFKYYFIENNVDKICVSYIKYFMIAL